MGVVVPEPATPAEKLAAAEAELARILAETTARRERLANVEAAGLSVVQIRELSDRCALSDPAEVEAARIAVAEARIAALEVELAERVADRGPAEAALEEVLPVLEAAQLAVAQARGRVNATWAHDVQSELREARAALTRAQDAATQGAAARWRALAGIAEAPAATSLVEVHEVHTYDGQGVRRAERPVQEGFMQHADVIVTPWVD